MAGRRAVRVSLEILSELLRGHIGPVETLDAPADIAVVGTLYEGERGSVTFICESSAWEGGQIESFTPTYRSKET